MLFVVCCDVDWLLLSDVDDSLLLESFKSEANWFNESKALLTLESSVEWLLLLLLYLNDDSDGWSDWLFSVSTSDWFDDVVWLFDLSDESWGDASIVVCCCDDSVLSSSEEVVFVAFCHH